MVRVQAAALDLFEQRGYDRVSIDDIARAADIGPATIYRHFGTKERLVLWDEYDPLLLDALARALPGACVIDAVRRALTVSLAQIYRHDRPRILRRARLIRSTPALQAAAADDQRQLRAALADAFLAHGHAPDPLAAAVFGGAIAAAIEAGIDRWLDGDGHEPLARCFTMALRRLRHLAGP